MLEMPSTYYWRPVEKTNFTVGIVVADGDKEEILSSQAIPSGTLFSLVDLVGCGIWDTGCGMRKHVGVKRYDEI